MGGWNAFPGGRMSPGDASVEVRGTMDGERAFLDSGHFGAQPACAMRELFEETGILAAVGPAPDRRDLDKAREQLLADQLDFGKWLAERDLAVDASRLRFAGRWVTPPLSPIRFDASFFLLEWQAGEPSQPNVIPGELESGEWIRPADALDRWLEGDVLLAQPTLQTLRVLAKHGPEGRDRLWLSESHQPNSPRSIEFRPAVRAIPIPTRTLPPATHTNTLLIGGRDLVLIDPGSADSDALQCLQGIIERESRREGGRLRGIWLSHHHIDHVAGAEALRRRYPVPVLAHTATAARLSGHGVQIDGRLEDGQVVDLDGTPRLRVRVIHTPGHASGHLCFLEERSGTLLCGDMLSGWGTVVINPPDGSMDDYLESLDRLRALGARAALPSHGSMFHHPAKALGDARRHRLWREDRVMEAWAGGLREPDLMLAPVYGDLDPAVRPVAVRQVLAHLERLEQTGRVGELPAGIRAAIGRVEGPQL